jgi:hypothetical protein
MNKPAHKEVMKFLAEPLLRRAVKLRAVLQDTTIQHVVSEILRSALSDEIAQVRQRGLLDDAPSEATPKATSRKPKKAGAMAPVDSR